jgi:hypothetical protein
LLVRLQVQPRLLVVLVVPAEQVQLRRVQAVPAVPVDLLLSLQCQVEQWHLP